MDLGRQQGSSLRNRCFSAFLVWPGGLPGRKKESPSRRRVNGAGPQAAHARGDAEQGGKAQPRLCSAFLLHPRTNPALLVPSWRCQVLSTLDTHGSTPGCSRGAQKPRAKLCPSAPKPNAAPRGPFRTGLCRMEPEMGCVEPQPAPSRGAAPSPGCRAGFGPAGPGGPNTKHAPSPAMQPHVHPKPQTLGEDSQEGTGSGASAFSRGPLALQSPPRDPLSPILTPLLAHGHAPTPRFTQGPAEASKWRRMSSAGREGRRRRRRGRPCWAPAPKGRQVMGREVRGPYEITAGRVAPGVLGDGDGSKSWWRGPAPWCCRTT